MSDPALSDKGHDSATGEPVKELAWSSLFGNPADAEPLLGEVEGSLESSTSTVDELGRVEGREDEFFAEDPKENNDMRLLFWVALLLGVAEEPLSLWWKRVISTANFKAVDSLNMEGSNKAQTEEKWGKTGKSQFEKMNPQIREPDERRKKAGDFFGLKRNCIATTTRDEC